MRAENPAQRLGVSFGRKGVAVSTGRYHLGLRLTAVGSGASLTGVGDAVPRARANRVTYALAGVDEWYANGPLGLEQGFTVPRPATRNQGESLTLVMALSGDLHASVASKGQTVAFSHRGVTSLSYGGLAASDANGRPLHTWLQLRANRLMLHVETQGARFPLTIDPLIQQGEKLTGSGETGEGWFGESVALSANGKTAIVGAPQDNGGVGAAWIFTRVAGTWTQQGEKLTGSGEVGVGFFGRSVALSANGSTAIIGGPVDNEAGAAWVFTRAEGKWTQQGSKLTGGGEVGHGQFGFSVALSSDGNTALIGGFKDEELFHETHGAAWVFVRSEGAWSQQGSKLTGGEEEGESLFGSSVALSSDGDTALIGGKADGAPFTKKNGAAWVFTRSGASWSQQGPKLAVEDTRETGYQLGDAVALSADGSTALIGAFRYGPAGGKNERGAAWVFTRAGSIWAEQAKLTGNGAGATAELGYGVALSADGNTALAGGKFEEASDGAGWIFSRVGATWEQAGHSFHGSNNKKAEMGTSVAVSADGSTALFGGPTDNEDIGAAWAFTYIFSPEELYGIENEAEPELKRPCSGDPVNCATGNEVESQTDLSIAGRGPGLRLTRTYNSQLAATQSAPGPFGYGWTGPYSAHLVINEEAETATVHQDNGSTVTFDLTASKTYTVAGSWVQATLKKEGSSYAFTLPDQTKLAFNEAGQLESETDRNGNVITVSHNVEGRIEAITDAATRKLSFAYNEEGYVESIKDPMGHTVKYTYEGGNLISVTQPGAETLRWQFKYDSEHEMTSETDGRENTTTTEYNGSHRAIAQTDAMGRTRKWQYNLTEAGEAQTAITEPNGAETVETFNAALLPTSITYASGAAYAATTTYEYDASYNLIATTDPDKHTTKFGYDSAGNRTSSKDANGNETKWTYNATHDIETMTTPKGETTTYKRDSHGNPETISRPAPGATTQTTSYKYGPHGEIESMENPLKHVWKYGYNSAGDRISETDPEGNKQTWEYNENSQEISAVSPRGNITGGKPAEFTTKTERDALGRAIKITDPLGDETKYSFDGNGNLESVVDPNGHKTKYTYDADNEQTSTEAPNGMVTEMGYDNAGKVTSQVDGNKHTTKYVRNLLEEIAESIDPLGRKTADEYDTAGNLKASTDAAKRTTTYTYDAGNRLKEITYSDGKTPTIKLEYDKDSDRTGMTDGSGTSKYTFDQLDRLTEAKDGHGDTTKYEYDLANEQTKITYPNTKAVTRTFDKDGRLEKVTDWSSHATKFTYDPDSELKATIFPSETKGEDTYSYNDADRMSEAKMLKSTESLASLSYTRDADGQIKGVTSKGLPGEEKPAFEYDVNSRVSKGAGIAYEYDNADDPTKLGAGTDKYDEANELESGPTAAYTYDEVGERIKEKPTSGPTTSYTYSQAGNLTAIERPKEGATPEIKDAYTYDGSGLRAAQTIAGATTYLIWNVTEALPTLLSDTSNSYIYGPQGWPIEQISSGGTVSYLHHDQQGSTRLLTGSTGAVVGSTTFDAYGNKTGSTGTSTTPLGFDAQYTSADTGFIYLRARTYDPKTGQFLSRDTLLKLTKAPYTYASDNPVNRSDPSGLCVEFGPGPEHCSGGCHPFREAEEALKKQGEEQVRHHCHNNQVVIEGRCVSTPPQPPAGGPPPPQLEPPVEEVPILIPFPLPVPVLIPD